MKIFAVYANPILIEKPKWFDDFYRSYGGGYDLHITLKQSCFVDEKDEEDIQGKLANFFASLKIPNHIINIVFDVIVIPKEGCIMVNARANSTLNQLQKNIVHALKDYSHYTTPELEAYEKNFIGHMTIARDVSLVAESFAVLRSDCFFKTEVRNITCIFVNEQTLEESQNQNNKRIYKL